jgi:hypothetical protein
MWSTLIQQIPNLPHNEVAEGSEVELPQASFEWCINTGL